MLLPTAMPGILTGVMLAVARAAGETAPLLFTALFSSFWLFDSGAKLMQPTASLAVLIYNFAGMPFENQIELAWAASLVLVLIVLVINCRQPSGRPAPSVTDRRDFDDVLISASEYPTPPAANGARPTASVVIDCKLDQVFYGAFLAVRDSHVPIERGKITAFIGPSGCGKSTVLRCLNRMNDLIRGFRFEGHVQFHGRDVYERTIDPVAVRRYIGMVFQQPNPFSMSIFDNVAFGLRLNRLQGQRGRAGREGAAPGRAVGRGEGQAQEQRAVALRRPAAAAVHRPRGRHRARACC